MQQSGGYYQPPFPINPMGGGAPFNAFSQPKSLAPALYVGDLDENVQEETLYDFFQSYGSIHFVRIMRDNQTGKSRGYAFVNFVNPRDAETAKGHAQYAKLGNKCIRIMFKRNIKDMPTDANVYVKNIDPSATMKDLHNHFSQATNLSGTPIGVVSVKIAQDSEGKSLGYGYVQFEKSEDAKFALEHMNGSKLKETNLELFEFIPKDKRQAQIAKRNLYIKNLPNGNEETVTATVKDLFSSYGEIESMKCLERGGKWAAFVCFKKAEDAENSIKDIETNQIKLDGENVLYVNYHQSKQSRQRELQKEHAQSQNETNLYVKNLKLDITEDQVKKAFSQFGQVTSVAVKEWKSQTGQKNAKFGFIAFKNADDAKRAVAAALENQDVIGIYLPGEPRYINLHQSKERRTEFIHSKKRAKMQMQATMMPPTMDPYRNPYMMMPMNRRFQPPVFGMYPGGGKGQMGNRGGPGGPKGGQGGKPTGGPNKGPGQRQQGGYNQGGNQGGYNKGPRTNNQQQQGGNKQQVNPNINKGNNTQQTQQQKPTTQQTTQQPSQPTVSVGQLKNKLNEFLALDQNQQRHILGELLYPKIRQRVDDNLAPKITGMLIDLSVLEVSEILEFLEDESLLTERIQEAKELIEGEGA